TIQLIDPGLKVDFQSHLKLSEINTFGLMPDNPDYFSGKNLIYGTIGEVPLQISEIYAEWKEDNRKIPAKSGIFNALEVIASNHLTDEGIIYLSTHIEHLENKKLTLYTGTYDEFERKRAEKLLGQQALHEKQMAQKAHMQAFVDRFGATASKARQAQSRLKAIQKMDIVDAVMADRVTAFEFPEPDQQKSPMLVLEQVEAGYETGKPILKRLDLRIDADDRIALLGANGNGKSTLIKLLSGRLPPLTGQIHKSSKLRVGYFAQFQTDELDVLQTPFEVMKDAMKGVAESRIRASLSKFGFDKHKADTVVGDLSGGEKARLLFCLMSFDAPHIMLLDEPTNHLDMDAREALTQALNNYKGAVILVSHDPHLVDSVVDRLWLVADGTCKPYDDDLEAYRKLVVNQRKKEREETKKEARKKKAG
ncbi:MAG: ATP-binding cassette domain-containing protein, partial [Rickettsiales bacterium]